MKHHLKLCIKEVTGNINSSEKIQLDKWLSESDKNKAEYEKIKTLWASFPNAVEDSHLMSIPEFPDTEIEWNRLFIRLTNEAKKHAIEDSSVNNIFQFIYGIFRNNLKPVLGTAAVILIVVTGILLWNRADYTAKIKTFSTANKERLKVELPDGSVAELNSASRISFLETFSDSIREVHLNGEAFFSVTKGTKPFIVKTGNASTRVLGTKFDIWARQQVTRVIVKEGRVKLTAGKDDSKGVVLLQNQTSTLTENEKPTVPENINADNLIGWMTGKLVFAQTPLGEIINEIERHYDTQVILAVDSLKNRTLTGAVKSNDVDSVLAMICLTLNLDFKKQNNGYVIGTKN